MRYKATLFLGFAAGYVLGTRAGREQYDRLVRAGHRVAENPSVQETAGVLQAQASDYAGAARKKLGDTLDDRFGTKVPAAVRTRIYGTEPPPARTRTEGPAPRV